MHLLTCPLLLHSIVEGESQQAVDNELVGRFEVSGLRDMPSGIDVTFAINDSGMLEVHKRHLQNTCCHFGLLSMWALLRCERFLGSTAPDICNAASLPIACAELISDCSSGRIAY
jgi:Hsp70 protein